MSALRGVGFQEPSGQGLAVVSAPRCMSRADDGLPSCPLFINSYGPVGLKVSPGVDVSTVLFFIKSAPWSGL